MARLFLAIPIDEHCQQQMDALVAPWQTGDAALRWTAPSNRHLTLVFLGDVSAPQQQQLLAHGHLLPRPEPFAMVFDGLQRFPDARGNVLALTASAENSTLTELHTAVSCWVENCGVPNRDQGRRFRPHITLARIHAPARFVLPTAWPAHAGQVMLRVERVQLYSSEQIEGRRVYRSLL